MKMNLYRVEVSVTILVYAPDEQTAVSEAEEHAGKELLDNGADTISVDLVESLNDIPREWRTAYPYGGDGEQNCSEILA